VIVPARNAEATIGRTLAGLATQRLEVGFEVIVVDDGSTDATAELACASTLKPLVVVADGAGPAAARNAGAAVARGAALAFVDADCEPEPGWLAAGLAALEAADLVQGTVRPPDAVRIGPFDRTIWVLREHGLYETANLFVSRALFDRLGGFESWLRPGRGIELGEDVWFGWRARRAGARVDYCAEAVVRHAVFQRDAVGYVAERARLRYFPHMAARIPELRKVFFYRRLFLNRRAAVFDVAVAAAAFSVARRSPYALVAAAPYLRLLTSHALRDGLRRSPIVGLVDLAADSVGLMALAGGSLEARSLLL